MKKLLILLVTINTVQAADIVTIEQAKYAFNVMSVTATIEERMESPDLGVWDKCVQAMMRDGIDDIEAETTCERIVK